ncbi:hypothetical protein [Nonomuraea typhae]|uniref:Uncharacterized protein n=1 Tax=Nonomuraea typhae TaxID=2603600 RepID=A0ABW7YW33_9ACTN
MDPSNRASGSSSRSRRARRGRRRNQSALSEPRTQAARTAAQSVRFCRHLSSHQVRPDPRGDRA